MRTAQGNPDKSDEEVMQGKLNALFVEARQLLRDMKIFLREQRLETEQDRRDRQRRH